MVAGGKNFYGRRRSGVLIMRITQLTSTEAGAQLGKKVHENNGQLHIDRRRLDQNTKV